MKYKTVRVCHLQIKTFPGIYRENSPAGRICVKYSSPSPTQSPAASKQDFIKSFY